MVLLGSYCWKSPNRKVILFFLLLSYYGVLVCMALFSSEHSYYAFVNNSPFGAILYFAATLRYLGGTVVSVAFDVSYLLVIGIQMFSLIFSFIRSKANVIIYILCAIDIIINLCSLSFLGIAGDLFIIFATKLSLK